MIDIFKNPLSLEDGMTVSWEAFEGEFLSLYRGICRKRGPRCKIKARAIIKLCRAGVGGFLGQKDLQSARRVIGYYASHASTIHSAGSFHDVGDFDIVSYQSGQERKQLQSKVLPKIVSSRHTSGKTYACEKAAHLGKLDSRELLTEKETRRNVAKYLRVRPRVHRGKRERTAGARRAGHRRARTR